MSKQRVQARAKAFERSRVRGARRHLEGGSRALGGYVVNRQALPRRRPARRAWTIVQTVQTGDPLLSGCGLGRHHDDAQTLIDWGFEVALFRTCRTASWKACGHRGIAAINVTLELTSGR